MKKDFFHDLEERQYFSLEQFNADLWEKLDELNEQNLKNRDYSRHDRWQEEKDELNAAAFYFLSLHGTERGQSIK